MRCTSSVSVITLCKLVSGWGLLKQRSAPLSGPSGSGRTLHFCSISLLPESLRPDLYVCIFGPSCATANFCRGIVWHDVTYSWSLTGWRCFLSTSFFLFVSLCFSLSTLDRRRVVAPSMLTDPSQHSKPQKDRTLCLWWPAPPSIFPDDLVVSSRCQTVPSPFVTWLRGVWLGGQEQPDPYAWRGQEESVSSDS